MSIRIGSGMPLHIALASMLRWVRSLATSLTAVNWQDAGSRGIELLSRTVTVLAGTFHRTAWESAAPGTPTVPPIKPVSVIVMGYASTAPGGKGSRVPMACPGFQTTACPGEPGLARV